VTLLFTKDCIIILYTTRKYQAVFILQVLNWMLVFALPLIRTKSFNVL